MFTDKEREWIQKMIEEKYPIHWGEGEPSKATTNYKKMLESIRTKLERQQLPKLEVYSFNDVEEEGGRREKVLDISLDDFDPGTGQYSGSWVEQDDSVREYYIRI